MIDGCGRTIDYLRISLTPSCDLNCFYCQPESSQCSLAGVLDPDQIERFVRAAAGLGVTRVRLTGGEPLLRPDLEEIVARIAAVHGISDISLTTNAQQLEQRAAALKQAGLRRINVSLDTLQPERYRRFTGGGDLQRVFAGLRAAEACGLSPIHLNVVAMKGVNDDEIAALAELTMTHDWDVRFIELMQIGVTRESGRQQLLSADQIWRLLGRPEAAPDSDGAGPARYYCLPKARGKVGLISAVSEHFCGDCNRIRLTSNGKLRLCLLAEDELDFWPLLQPSVSPAELSRALQEAVGLKPSEQPHVPRATRRMSEIGG